MAYKLTSMGPWPRACSPTHGAIAARHRRRSGHETQAGDLWVASQHLASTFPRHNSVEDGWLTTRPIRTLTPNGFGL